MLFVAGFWLRQGAQGVTISVRPFVPNLSRALNLHLSLSGQSQVSPRSVPDQSQVNLRPVSGQSLVSLKYFVLLNYMSSVVIPTFNDNSPDSCFIVTE